MNAAVHRGQKGRISGIVSWYQSSQAHARTHARHRSPSKSSNSNRLHYRNMRHYRMLSQCDRTSDVPSRLIGVGNYNDQMCVRVSAHLALRAPRCFVQRFQREILTNIEGVILSNNLSWIGRMDLKNRQLECLFVCCQVSIFCTRI